MSAARRGTIAVIAVLALMTTAGAVWLVRLVSAPPQPRIVAADPGASETPTSTPGDNATPDAPETATETPPTPGRDLTPYKTSTPHLTRRPATSSPALTSSPSSTSSAPRPPVPSRAIRVGGATLNNENPRTPCVVFKNTALGLPVRVVAVRVSGGGLHIAAGKCAEDDNIASFPECVPGMTLRSDRGCFAGVSTDTDTPGEYVGTVQLRLRARCTTTTVPVCDVAELRASPPSVARPIDIFWNDGGRRACFKVHEPDPQGGEPFGPFCESTY